MRCRDSYAESVLLALGLAGAEWDTDPDEEEGRVEGGRGRWKGQRLGDQRQVGQKQVGGRSRAAVGEVGEKLPVSLSAGEEGGGVLEREAEAKGTSEGAEGEGIAMGQGKGGDTEGAPLARGAGAEELQGRGGAEGEGDGGGSLAYLRSCGSSERRETAFETAQRDRLAAYLQPPTPSLVRA